MYQIPSITQFLASHLHIYYSSLLGPNCSPLVFLANSWMSNKCPSDMSSMPAVSGRLSYTLILHLCLVQPSVAFTMTLIIGLAWSFFQVFPEWFFHIYITFSFRLLSSSWKWKSLSHVQLFATPWAIQFMEFSRPEYWTTPVAFSFSRGSFQLKDWTQVSCIASGFFTSWATSKVQEYWCG